MHAPCEPEKCVRCGWAEPSTGVHQIQWIDLLLRSTVFKFPPAGSGLTSRGRCSLELSRRVCPLLTVCQASPHVFRGPVVKTRSHLAEGGGGEGGRASRGEAAGTAQALVWWVGRRGWTEEGGEVWVSVANSGVPRPPHPRHTGNWAVGLGHLAGCGRHTQGAHAHILASMPPHDPLPSNAGGTRDWLLTKSDGCT